MLASMGDIAEQKKRLKDVLKGEHEIPDYSHMGGLRLKCGVGSKRSGVRGMGRLRGEPWRRACGRRVFRVRRVRVTVGREPFAAMLLAVLGVEHVASAVCESRGQHGAAHAS